LWQIAGDGGHRFQIQKALIMAVTSNALDGLLYIRNGYQASRWNFPDAVGTPLNAPGGIGNAVDLSFSFPGTLPSYSSETGFQAFNSTQQQATRTVLSSIEASIDVDFTEVSGVGQIAFGMSSQPSGQGGYAHGPAFSYSYWTDISSVTEIANGGDVWLNRNISWTADDWATGQDGYVTLLHEIGHALGLKHPFDGTSTLSASLDNESHTVMSYSQAPNSTLIAVSGNQYSYSWVTSHLRPSTLMPMDIEALQYLYGANTSTRTGNDVYRWSLNAELLETIWDSAGTDTIDCANQTLTCIIDLRAENYSSIALRQTDAEKRVGLDLPIWFFGSLPTDIYNGSNNLAIAKGVVIEKALGGSGNDQLIGNDASNTLVGGAGNDSLTGGLGNDSLDGGSGVDTMTGGDGNDYYYLRDAGDSISETNAATSGGADTIYCYLASYTLGNNVENGRIMSAGTANLTGNMLNNFLYAGQGNNAIAGGDGIDTVSFYYGATGTTGVTASLVTGQATGSGSDTLTSIERLYGSNNADRFTGDAKANYLYGYAGNDTLDGGAGIDTLVGGVGRDSLAGGSGNDIFDFNLLSEMGLVTDSNTWDVITDFSTGDRIDLSSLDANTSNTVGSNDTFSSALVSTFTAAGQLKFDNVAHVLYGNSDSNLATFEWAIKLTGVNTLVTADFVL